MLEWITDIRRDFHMHPETAHEETRTTARIRELLLQMGVEVLETHNLTTGVVGIIRCGGEGPTLGLRADIDALNVTELGDVSYKSTIDGKMHACGHDGHAAMLLGVAKTLVESGVTSQLKGNIKLIFQPAEEGLSGAKKMVEAGVLENPKVDMILAAHMLPDLSEGSIGICRGFSHAASDRVSLTVRGKGTHAAKPHQGVDPVVAGAFFVTSAQSIVSRSIDPILSAVVTFGRFQAGSAFNIIPETATLEGTIRTLDPKVRERVRRRLEEQADGLDAMFGVKTELEFQDGIPACFNHQAASDLLSEAAGKVVGPDSVSNAPPVLGGEDFALFTEKVPGAIFRVGCGNQEKGLVHPLHSPYFDIDEKSLVVGMNVFLKAAKLYLR